MQHAIAVHGKQGLFSAVDPQTGLVVQGVDLLGRRSNQMVQVWEIMVQQGGRTYPLCDCDDHLPHIAALWEKGFGKEWGVLKKLRAYVEARSSQDEVRGSKQPTDDQKLHWEVARILSIRSQKGSHGLQVLVLFLHFCRKADAEWVNVDDVDTAALRKYMLALENLQKSSPMLPGGVTRDLVTELLAAQPANLKQQLKFGCVRKCLSLLLSGGRDGVDPLPHKALQSHDLRFRDAHYLTEQMSHVQCVKAKQDCKNGMICGETINWALESHTHLTLKKCKGKPLPVSKNQRQPDTHASPGCGRFLAITWPKQPSSSSSSSSSSSP